ncbi:hypothetical protein FD754_011659 [Muntiacus muntjak]|uniref:Lipid-binding serum glycoprotein N-terminal domain-containing protein n=1 Tax=Muntiacus muntjak TaxID=9888 RepID=A0A5N3VCG6_MUNMU|nr:hypothetical protein FD754_011659 [Muntiacus muntjak]
MFQLWKLVLLCGLLAGTSASLLDNIRKDVLRKLKSGLEEGLNLDNTLETIFQQLKTDFTLPQESNTEEAQDNPEETQDNTEETQDDPEETQDNTEETQDDPEETQDNTEETKNLLEELISGIFQVVYRLTGVKISDLHILDLTLEATSESSAEVKIPITAHVNVKLPVFGEIVDLDLNLVLQFSVSVETDEETGVSQVVVEECRNDQHSIELTVPRREQSLVKKRSDSGVKLALPLTCSFGTNLASRSFSFHILLSLVTQYEVSPPILGVQSQAWRGWG